jgi:Mlc titration factor MtfA (ptsG expression regulator)
MILGLFRKLRRKRLRERPLPFEWQTILDRNVPYLRRLLPEERRKLEGDIQVFIAEKNFEGCGGLEITDEIRVTIAAQACILLLNLSHDYYSNLTSIVVYPSSYLVPIQTVLPGGAIWEVDEAREGEAWKYGTVVLSWDGVRHRAAGMDDGHNVVFHEFAHLLDQEDGEAGGTPILPSRRRYASWARILGDEYEALLDSIHQHQPTLIDQYGAKGPAEFFAVVTECFFEKPVELREEHPELYEEMKAFYRQDPAARIG